MATGIVPDQNLEKQIEKQMGCMAGFLQLFDRQQILTGKRLYATKRLPPTTMGNSTPVSERYVGSPAFSRELEKPQQTRTIISSSPDCSKPSPVTELQSTAKEPAGSADVPTKMPLPLPIYEFKEGTTRSSWKFCKETPRLSLDSRATVDTKGAFYPREIRTNAAILSVNRCEDSGDGAVTDGDDKQRRSPSVIARLMGLEQLPHSSPEPVKKAELRRSASESRVSRDLFQYRSIDGNHFQMKQLKQLHSVESNISGNVIRDNAGIKTNTMPSNVRPVYTMNYSSRNAKPEQPKSSHRNLYASPWKSHQQRKSFFDSEDFFPEPKQTVSVYGEIERRLKIRGIDEPSKDLETLKQILEALQLKGLLHTKKPTEQISRRNFVYDRSFLSDESPIVVMKPSRYPVSPINRRTANDSSPSSFKCRAGVRRNVNLSGENSQTASPLRERPDVDRNVRNQGRPRNSSSPTRSESTAKSPNSLVRRKSLSIEPPWKANESMERRRVAPVRSPKLCSRRSGSDQTTTVRSPRNRKPAAEIYPKEKTAVVTEDESSSISESTVSTSSQTDTERSKMEEYREGRSLLDRCDKLLHSIAEMTAAELQPSPVSVLEYKDESSSPSPVMKRSIDFKDQPGGLEEEEIWSPAISPIQLNSEENSDDCDYVYISEIFRACHYLPEDSDIFLLLEKQQYLEGKDTSKVSTLQRRLIFDTISEILDRNRQLPPSKAFSWSNSSNAKSSLQQIWSEFQRIRQRDTVEDLFEIVCSLMRKDLAGNAIYRWGDCSVEMSEAVLDIERLIFKDLVGETIRELAAFAGKSIVSAPRRKLAF